MRCKIVDIRSGGIFMLAAHFIETVLIVAATALLFRHAAFTAFRFRGFVKLYPGLLSHAIMRFHGNARRHHQVNKRYQ